MTPKNTHDDPALAALESQLEAAKLRVSRIESAIAAYLGESPRQTGTATKLYRTTLRRPQQGGVSWVRESIQVLRDHHRPMHWTEIVDALRQKGLPVPEKKKARDTISGVLTRLAREGKEIDHVSAGTFGLLAWKGEKSNGKKREPITSRPESATTLKLIEIISDTPGMTNGEVVTALERRLGESAEEAAKSRPSRVTRLGQLVNRGRVRRENGRFHPIEPV